MPIDTVLFLEQLEISGILGNSSLDPSADPAAWQTAPYIAPWQVVVASLFILINGGLSIYLRLGMHMPLAGELVRCILQLVLFGYLLGPIFNAGGGWLTMVLVAAMMSITAAEIISQPHYAYNGMLRHMLLALMGSGSACLVFAAVAAVRAEPWWSPRLMLPLAGVLLGHISYPLSSAISTALEELRAGQEAVEVALALGATRWEATRSVVQRALGRAMLPAAAYAGGGGLAGMPGVLAGMVLQGADPVQAAHYQLVVVFTVSGATALAALAAVLLAVASVVDGQHRFRREGLRRRDRRAGVLPWLHAQLRKVALWVRAVWRRVDGACCGGRRAATWRGAVAMDWTPQAQPPLRLWGLGTGHADYMQTMMSVEDAFVSPSPPPLFRAGDPAGLGGLRARSPLAADEDEDAFELSGGSGADEGDDSAALSPHARSTAPPFARFARG